MGEIVPLFRPNVAYPIDTLPDDLGDDNVPNSEKWTLRGALFWNDCQGWWVEDVAEYWLAHRYGKPHSARFWKPLPSTPMTDEEIQAERK